MEKRRARNAMPAAARLDQKPPGDTGLRLRRLKTWLAQSCGFYWEAAEKDRAAGAFLSACQ